MNSNSSAKVTVTAASLNLLLALVADSGNWSNNPMVNVSDSEKGNLTHLKKAGLVSTFRDEGTDWINFCFETAIVTDGARTFSLTKGEYSTSATAVTAA